MRDLASFADGRLLDELRSVESAIAEAPPHLVEPMCDYYDALLIEVDERGLESAA